MASTSVWFRQPLSHQAITVVPSALGVKSMTIALVMPAMFRAPALVTTFASVMSTFSLDMIRAVVPSLRMVTVLPPQVLPSATTWKLP